MEEEKYPYLKMFFEFDKIDKSNINDLKRAICGLMNEVYHLEIDLEKE